MTIQKDIASLIWGERDISIQFDNENIKDDKFIDLYTRESHSIKLKKSSYNSENGYEFSDNAVRQPKKIKISGFVSNIFSYQKTLGIISIDSNDKVMQAWKYLNDALYKKSNLNIMTTLGIYTNMLLIEINVPDISEATGTSMLFDMTFEENIVVSTSDKKISMDNISSSTGISNSSDKVNRGNLDSPHETRSFLSPLTGGF